jgi:hypothetical protein
MRNVINKDLALIMLVIIVMLGSGTFHDAFGLEESEKVSVTDENMDFLLRYERYMADRYGLHSDGTGLTEDLSQQDKAVDSTLYASHLRSQNIFAPSALAQALYGASVADAAKGASASKDAGGQSLAEQATDPTAPLVQLRFQNSFVPESFDSTGYANTTEIQAVIPWKAPWGQPMITRPTFLFPLTADPDGTVNETSGMGDTDMLHFFISKQEWGTTALGVNVVFPTATDTRLGSGKWQGGPAAALVYTKIPKLQLGALVYNNWSLDTNRHGKENVNKMYIQWVVNYHFEPGWYVGWGDLPMSFNWKNGKQNIPLCGKLGHTTKIGKQPVDMFIQPFYTISHDGPSGEYGAKFNLTFLFP